jgi:putative glutamine amidotransferase
MPRPIIGITVDNRDNVSVNGKFESPMHYSQAVADAGGVPVLLPQLVEMIDDYLRLCDGFVFTGGDDVRMDLLRGEPMHPQAKAVAQRRQAFELALLAALDPLPDVPVLGICYGMQLMTLHAGGTINQHLPDTLPSAASHQKRNLHLVQIAHATAAFEPKDAGDPIVSSHHQGMTSPGRLTVAATAADGVIEAVHDPSRRFYVGVQWHPERGGDGPLSQGVLNRLVDACRRARK